MILTFTVMLITARLDNNHSSILIMFRNIEGTLIST